MKRIVFIFVVSILFTSMAFAQGCFPDGITIMSQDSIDNFEIYFPGCTVIEGDLLISGSDITNLNGLNILTDVNGDLRIEHCDYLTSLTGLENITTIGGYLSIRYDDSIVNLTGLNSLSNVGSLYFSHLDSFISFTPLENITHLEGSLSIQNCNELTDFSNLSSLSTIYGGIDIQNNSSLINFEGLNSLTSIGDAFLINGNNSLMNFEGLNSLTNIGGGIYISYCTSLENLEGLNNLNSIEHNIEITSNENINSFSALMNVNSNVEVLIIYGNNSLTSLSGLDNIDFTAGFLTMDIYDNPSLSYCETESICEAVALFGNVLQVYNNAPGCDNIFEISDACQTGLTEPSEESNFSIHLNPSNNKLIINNTNGYKLEEITLYNISGQKVLQLKEFSNGIDISGLRKGIYIAEVKTNGLILRQKISIQ